MLKSTVDASQVSLGVKGIRDRVGTLTVDKEVVLKRQGLVVLFDVEISPLEGYFKAVFDHTSDRKGRVRSLRELKRTC